MTAILLAGLPLVAQVQVGDNVSLNLSGNVGFGYSGSYGDTLSSHGMAGNGDADLSGSYYSPQFLSFHVSPYLNQSRETSNFDSTSSTTGFRANANIFSGSHFPGYITYNRTYNSSSTYSVPGVGDYLNHGNSNSFGIGWSEIIPDFPSLSVGYQQGGSNFETYGASGESQTHNRTFNISSAYRIDGFGLNANYHHGTTEAQLPSLFFDGLPQTSESGNSSYSFGVTHALPLRGTAQAHYDSTYYDYTSSSGRNSGGIDTLNGSASLAPTDKLSLDGNLLYTDNLVGTLYQAVLAAGGNIQNSTPGWSSNSLTLSGDAVYSLTRQMRVIGRVTHRQQSLGDQTFESDSYGGVFSYFRMLLGGKFSFVQTVSRNTLSIRQESDLGLSTSASYSHSLGTWNLGGSLIYNQNQATALVTYQTTSYSYSGSVGRPIRKWYWSLNASGSKSSVGNSQGSDITSRNYATALSMRKIGLSASYSKSSGNAIQTPTGLTPSPLPLPVLPTAFVLYGGRSYSFGAGGSPIRGLTFTGTFVKTASSTSDASANSTNNAQLANFYMNYRLRKINLHAGYTRVFQGFSLAGTREQTVNSYYFGISRWFNFF